MLYGYSVLGHLLAFTCTYIDDVLVMLTHGTITWFMFNRCWSWDDHLVHVQQVLDALNDAGLTASPSKCVFGARSLSYLGHLVGVGYVSVPEARVRAIKEYRTSD